ncbi:MAG: glycosyltransferase [Candidatus Nanoarchaeia archaeon]|jgi:GT2 family glycosyltransferase
MKLSIIIPSYGRAKILDDCLNSINKIKNELKNYEIIVVNNNNNLTIEKETSKFCKKYDLNIIEITPHKGVGSIGARNLGIKKSRGDTLIFFDDDTLIQKNYFFELIKTYKDELVGAVGGAEIKEQKDSIFHKILFKFRKTGDITWSGEIISNFSPNIKNSIKVKHLHGSNFSIRKDIIKKIGLMDEKMMGHYRDETEFIYRVYELGYDVIFNPECRVIHTATNVGGNISPNKKKEWAYWYHRNTSYFFFKHLYKNNKLKLFCYLIREFFNSIIRTIIYKNPYYITQISQIRVNYLNLKQ